MFNKKIKAKMLRLEHKTDQLIKGLEELKDFVKQELFVHDYFSKKHGLIECIDLNDSDWFIKSVGGSILNWQFHQYIPKSTAKTFNVLDSQGIIRTKYTTEKGYKENEAKIMGWEQAVKAYKKK